MKHQYAIKIIVLILSLSAILVSCKKQDGFLDTKPNQALAVPSTLGDLQALINNEPIFNTFYPSLGLISTDDYYLTNDYWPTIGTTGKNSYIWAKEIYAVNTNVQDWNWSYDQIYYANTILNVLPGIKTASGEQVESNNIKGSALFFRAMAFYNLVQTFAMPYDSATAGKDLGVPMPLIPSLTAKLPRLPESQCYAQILSDLNIAATLLPDLPATKTRPSKAAVLGLLSRIYMVLGNYTLSLKNAAACLALYDQLQDFNKLDPAAFPVYPNFSPEELYHASFTGYDNNGFEALVDTNLYRSFTSPDDLRPSIFFYNNNGAIGFNSQYDKLNNLSATISTDEIYLNKAESEARLGNTNAAMTDLNTMLITRWSTGTFKPHTAISADDALVQILSERRKELVFTGLRWSDLRRLNKDSRFAITLYRNINGVVYSLPPNDLRYAMPIPDNEIQLNPMPQNIR